jgi:hypothetical protein
MFSVHGPAQKSNPGLTMIYLTSVVALAIVYLPVPGSDSAGMVRGRLEIGWSEVC